MEQFMAECACTYGVTLTPLAGSFKAALVTLLQAHPIRVIVMGQRRIDPDAANLTVAAASDPGWPVFVRLNPILDWSYALVWRFLLQFELPYCVLYDRGCVHVKNCVPRI